MSRNVLVRSCVALFVPFALASLTGCATKSPAADMTDDQMMAEMMTAATPGEPHQRLRARNGTWIGKSKMWMAPGTEPIASECSATFSTMFDGRFSKCEISGEMPGMGPFTGFSLNGYDNVSQKYVSTWVDNFGTGMMTGTGDASADGKTTTWNYTFNCPVQKKPVTMREIETNTSDSTFTLEMFGPDPRTGEEFKTMLIEFRRK